MAFHVASLRRRHVGASIHEAWTASLDTVQTMLDATLADDRTILLRATSQEVSTTRELSASLRPFGLALP